MSVLWRAERLTTWGRSRFANVAAGSPDSCDAAAQAISGADAPKGPRGVIAYGAGRCYGDAALNDHGQTILTGALNRILSFNPSTREAVLEAHFRTAGTPVSRAQIHVCGFLRNRCGNGRGSDRQ